MRKPLILIYKAGSLVEGPGGAREAEVNKAASLSLIYGRVASSAFIALAFCSESL
jgi:hypothetical protein